MALSTVPFMPKDGTLTIEDATGSPITLTVAYEDGDFQASGWIEDHWEITEFRDRGEIYELRKSQEVPIEFSFSAHATDLADGTEKTLLDVVMKTGAFASGVSTWGASAEVWTVKVTFAADASSFGGASSTIAMTYCHLTGAFAEGEPGKFSITGRAFLKSGSGITRT